MPFFLDHRGELRTIWADDGTRLRIGQLGAVWSAASHFTVSGDPIQLVLPTGVGKTAVMTLLPFLIPTKRALVVTPSRLVRDQAVDEFKTLDVLRRTESISPTVPKPQVRKVEHRLGTEDDWAALEEFDVAIGTPSVLSPAYQAIADPPDELFDLLIVDEAHHAAAATWEALLESFAGVRTVLLTATPFRRDRKGLPGSIAYTYPISIALEEGVFAPINFLPVDAPVGADRDRLLAEAAAARLDLPEHEHSRLLIRTDRKDEAERLVEVYSDAGIEIGVIHSGQSLRTAKRVLSQLESGEIVGVSSVGILGEGFDFPALKIAVYHRRHKSLPATLQFVGRIARVGQGEFGPAELLAIREDVQDETRELYEADVGWTDLVPGLIDAAVAEERTRREYLGQLAEPAHEEFSIYAVQPPRHAEVFRLPDEAEVALEYPRHLLGDGLVIHVADDADGELLMIVTQRVVHPRWLSTSALDTFGYELHLVVLLTTERLIFISSETDSTRRAVLEQIGAAGATRVGPEAMNRLLHRLHILRYSSVGMRSGRARGATSASYLTMAGSAVQRAVRGSEARTYGVGHLIGTHEFVDGRVGGIGVSIGTSKVWAWGVGDLLEYKSWCRGIGELMTQGGDVPTNAPLLPLQVPSTLLSFPDSPIAAVVDGRLFAMDCHVVIDGTAMHISAVEILPEKVDDTHLRCQFVTGDGPFWSCVFDVFGDATPDGEDIEVIIQGEPSSLFEVVQTFDLMFYFADGSSVLGATHFVPPQDLPEIPDNLVSVIDWSQTDIQSEAQEPAAGLKNIHTTMLDLLADQNPEAFVVIDDAAYEIADILVVSPIEDRAEVELVHCKFSSEAHSGVRLADVEVLFGQCIRSSRWTLTSRFWEEIARRLANRPAFRVVQGERDQFAALVDEWMQQPPETNFVTSAVQPGLVVADIHTNERVHMLTANSSEWVENQGAIFRIIGS